MLERLFIWNIYVILKKSIRFWGSVMWFVIKYVDRLVLMVVICGFVMEIIFEYIKYDGVVIMYFLYCFL